MPELAEVYYFSRRWDAGRRDIVQEVDLHPRARIFRGCDVKALKERLTGERLEAMLTHGKQMLAQFSGGCWLGLHLGMTGDMRVETADFSAGKHDHLVLRQAKRCLVFSDPRMFGRIRFDLSTDGPPAWWRALPPDLMDRRFTVAHLSTHLNRRTRAPLKAVLLDQALFPGVGNWMADEILWRMPAAPLTACGTLEPEAVKRLHREVRWVAKRALAIIGEGWSEPPASWLYPHRWEKGGRCPRCRTELLRQEMAGRTTCWCPQCQPTGEAKGRAVGSGRRRERPSDAERNAPAKSTQIRERK